MRLHFAGGDAIAVTNEWMHEQGVRDRLESFYMLKGKVPSMEGFDHYLLDSGGFVARTKGERIDVRAYAEFINQHGVKLAFNLDTNDVDETLANQELLDASCPGATILPIYHLSDYRSREHRGLLDTFIQQGHPYIGVGGVAGEGSARALQHGFYRYVFRQTGKRVRVHGLGITSRDILLTYPWFSVDSTSWFAEGVYGPNDKDARVRAFRSSLHWRERCTPRTQELLKLQDTATRLWTHRGFTWEDS